MTSVSKRSCPIRQLSLQQDIKPLSKRTSIQKQTSHDISSHLQITNSKIKCQTPDVKPKRNLSSKPKAVKLAWADRKSSFLSDNDGVEDKHLTSKVEVIAKKCKEIARPLTAKPTSKGIGDIKNTILYSKEELADRLKLAIKERQSRKQNLDIFLAHNINRPKSSSLLRTNVDLFLDNNDGQVPNIITKDKALVSVSVHDKPNFIPYEDMKKRKGEDVRGIGDETNLLEIVDNEVIVDKTYPVDAQNETDTSTISSISNNYCDNCAHNCNKTSQPLDETHTSSYFLMSSSPCLHHNDHTNVNKEMIKFNEIFNIEKQRPFSVRVIDDKIDIFNDDEEDDLLIIDSDEHEDAESLTSSSENIEACLEIDQPTLTVKNQSVEMSNNESKIKTNFQEELTEKKNDARLSASIKRNLFKNSGRNKNIFYNNSIKSGPLGKRNKLTRGTSAPNSGLILGKHLKKQSTVNGDIVNAVEDRLNKENNQIETSKQTGKGMKQSNNSITIPSIHITEEKHDPVSNQSKPLFDLSLKIDLNSNSQVNEAQSRNDSPNKLVLRKQNRIAQNSFINENLKNETCDQNSNQIRRTNSVENNNKKGLTNEIVRNITTDDEQQIKIRTNSEHNDFPIKPTRGDSKTELRYSCSKQKNQTQETVLNQTVTDGPANLTNRDSINSENKTSRTDIQTESRGSSSHLELFPGVYNKTTIQRQNDTKSNKISFQSTLSNYMKNETKLIKPILQSYESVDRPDRIRSAVMTTNNNRRKIKFSKKKFHKSFDDINLDQNVDGGNKKLNKISLGRDVVTMVSLLSDESDVECETPEPCNLVLHHPATIVILSQPVYNEGDFKQVVAPPETASSSMSTFQMCLRKPISKPVSLPIQTSSSGRSYSTLYPSRRGAGAVDSFETPPHTSAAVASFRAQSSGSLPQVSAAYKRKQTRVKSAPIIASNKADLDLESDNARGMETNVEHIDKTNPESKINVNNLKEKLNIVFNTSDIQSPNDVSKDNIASLDEEADVEKHDGNEDAKNESVETKVLGLNTTLSSLTDIEYNLDKPPIFRTDKEEDCWKMFQKMSRKGIQVKYDTILRGMLTPTEYRLHKKCNSNLERAESVGDNIAVN